MNCDWYIVFSIVIATGVNSLYLSPWVPIQAQVTSPIIITHPLGHIPAKVEVQVKVQEGGSEYIFPASGSAQRDDDSDNVYGGVVYIYNENHIKIFVPVQENTSNKGLAIYTGNDSFVGPFQASHAQAIVRVKVWGLCDLPKARFSLPGTMRISIINNHQSLSHGIGRYPDLVVVQLKLNNGYVSEAGGVTFNSIPEAEQSVCGTVFAYDDQEIRLWTVSGSSNQYVFCARDGWGTENVQGKSASLHIQAWVFNSKQFTRSFIMDKNNVDVTSPTTDTVPVDSTYSLDSMLVSVQMKALKGNNAGFTFYAGGSAMIDTSTDPYGAIIYAYTDTEVLLWRPNASVSHGFLIYVGGTWGNGTHSQQDTEVEVTVRVIDINGTLCSETDSCVQDWASMTTVCKSSDCPIPVDIKNANKLYDGLTNGSHTLYSCARGYTGSAHDSMALCVNGSWTTPDLYCEVCSTHNSSFLMNKTLEEWVNEVKKELTVNRKTTSAYTRTQISVYDERPSAVTIGVTGIILICTIALLLSLSDMIDLFKYIYHKRKRKLKRKMKIKSMT